jgi:hypothetical protein
LIFFAIITCKLRSVNLLVAKLSTLITGKEGGPGGFFFFVRKNKTANGESYDIAPDILDLCPGLMVSYIVFAGASSLSPT